MSDESSAGGLRKSDQHIQRMLSWILGIQIMTFGLMYYLFASQLGQPMSGHKDVVGILFVAGFLMMMSQELGTALERVVYYIRDRREKA